MNNTTMKKIYSAPQIKEAQLENHRSLLESIDLGGGSGGGTIGGMGAKNRDFEDVSTNDDDFWSTGK